MTCHPQTGTVVCGWASKMIRGLLLLPLFALLFVPGDKNHRCLAFQNHRHPVGRTSNPRVDHGLRPKMFLNDILGAATPNTNYFGFLRNNIHRDGRYDSSRIRAASSDDDEIEQDKNKTKKDLSSEEGWEFAMQLESRGSFQPLHKTNTNDEKKAKTPDNSADSGFDDEGRSKADAIAKLKAEIEAKRSRAESEATRLKAEAEKAARLKTEQEAKLKEAEAQLAKLRSEAEARERAELEAAKKQMEAEEKRKREAARLKAEAEARAEEEKNRLQAEKKAEEIATLLKAKEEAARVMAEIDAKLQAETAEADKFEDERVQMLQSDAEQMPGLDAEDDETLKMLMEEMEKVRIELDSRLKEEEEEEKARVQKEEEEAAFKKAEEEAASAEPGVPLDPVSELMQRIKSGASYEPPVAKPAKMKSPPVPEPIENKAAAPPPPRSTDLPTKTVSPPKPVDTVATTKAPPPKPMPMPDFSVGSKKKSEAKKTTKEESKPKWMVNWQDESSKEKPTAKDLDTDKTTAEDKEVPEASKEIVEDKPIQEKVTAKEKPSKEEKAVEEETVKEVKAEEKPVEEKIVVEDEAVKEVTAEGKEDEHKADPRTTGRSSKENLFDVIGRTAGGSASMDEIAKRKKQLQKTAPASPAEVVQESKKDGPPESFGDSVASSYNTKKSNSENQGPRRAMPDLQNMKELKKKGPPASFGSFAAAASGAAPPPNINGAAGGDKDIENGPPASFGASVAMAGSGDVPQDLLSRGTASTDAGASSPPPPKPASSARKRGHDSNIIDVVDVVYTKKDDHTKEKKTPPAQSNTQKAGQDSKKAFVGSNVPPSRPMSSAPPLEVEKTVPPIRNQPKKEGEPKTSPQPMGNRSPTIDTTATAGNPKKNVVSSEKKKVPKDNESKATTSDSSKKDGEDKKDAIEDRVALLLKEAFSLSKEDSRVAELLQGVVAITTGEDKKENKEKNDSDSVEKTSEKENTSARGAAVPPNNDDDAFARFDEDDFDDDDDYEDGEDTVIMGRGIGRRRRVEENNNFPRNGPTRRNVAPPTPPTRIENIRVENKWGDDGFIEAPLPPSDFDDIDGGEYFVDNDDDYFEYDENDRWRGTRPGSRRSEPPMRSGGYSVRPPPQSQSRGQQGFESDDDYYFLKFGSPSSSSQYDDRDGDRYYEDEDDFYYDEDDDGPQPGAPRPAFDISDDDSPKGPPSSFGNFVAGASMEKTGYAPTSMKEESSGGFGSGGGGGEEFGEEMNSSTGNMMAPRTNRVNGSSGGGGASPGRPPQAHFVVSEDESGGEDRGKKGPPSSFGNSVAAAGETQTGNPARSIEEEISNGGMATPTGSMATPRRRAPATPAAGGGNPVAPAVANRAGAGQGAPKKALFVVSEEEVGVPDFGSSVAEASGARTGWAPKAPKRPAGGLESGTTGGMRPKVKSPPAGTGPAKKEFGSAVFEACPLANEAVARKVKPAATPPVTSTQSFSTDLNIKHQRNPAVNLVDGGASRGPKRAVQFSGSMMSPRIVRSAQAEPKPEEQAAPPTEGKEEPEESEGQPNGSKI